MKTRIHRRNNQAAKFVAHFFFVPQSEYRLVDLVVNASASRAEDPGFESRLRRDFFRVETYQ